MGWECNSSGLTSLAHSKAVTSDCNLSRLVLGATTKSNQNSSRKEFSNVVELSKNSDTPEKALFGSWSLKKPGGAFLTNE